MDTEKLHSPGRILSIDALRGFDMLWILGASELAIALLTLKKTNLLYGWQQNLTMYHGMDLPFMT